MAGGVNHDVPLPGEEGGEQSSNDNYLANPDGQIKVIGNSPCVYRNGAWEAIGLVARPLTIDISSSEKIGKTEVYNYVGSPDFDPDKKLGDYYLKEDTVLAEKAGLEINLPVYGSLRVGEIKVRYEDGVNSDLVERSMGPMAVDGIRIHSLKVRFPTGNPGGGQYATDPRAYTPSESLPPYYPKY